MTERADDNGEEPYAAARRGGAAHAAALRTGTDGLPIQARLPPELVWSGIRARPFMLGEQKNLATYPDLRAELLRRTTEAAENDLPMPLDEVVTEMRARVAAPRPPASVWNSSVTCIGVTDPAGSPRR